MELGAARVITDTQKRWLGAAAVVLGVLFGLAVGRFTAPELVEEQLVAHQEVDEHEQVKAQQATETKRDTVSITRTKPALNPVTGELLGGCDAGVIMESETITRAAETSATLSDLTRASSLSTTSDVSSSTKTSVRPDWRVSVLAGAKVGPELQPRVLFGAGVERRLIGGLSAGAMGGVEIEPVSQQVTGGFALGTVSLEF